MSKILLAVLLVSFMVCTPVFAGGSGNCVQPLKTTTEHVGMGGAFEYNYIHSRMNDLNNKWGPKDMKVEKFNQIYGKVMFGLSDNVNIYGTVGGCNYDLEFIDKAQDATMDIDLENGIYTGAGLNALFPLTEWEAVTFGIGFDIQSNFFHNDVKGITRSGQSATGTGGAFFGIDGKESVYLTCKYDVEEIKTSIVPYVGAYHSWILEGTSKALSYTTPMAGNVDKEHFQPAYDLLGFGVLVGIDVDIAKYVNLNVEGRFIGETAITTGATVKF